MGSDPSVRYGSVQWHIRVCGGAHQQPHLNLSFVSERDPGFVQRESKHHRHSKASWVRGDRHVQHHNGSIQRVPAGPLCLPLPPGNTAPRPADVWQTQGNSSSIIWSDLDQSGRSTFRHLTNIKAAVDFTSQVDKFWSSRLPENMTSTTTRTRTGPGLSIKSAVHDMDQETWPKPSSYHVRGPVNQVYSEILLSRLCPRNTWVCVCVCVCVDQRWPRSLSVLFVWITELYYYKY